MMLMYKIVAGLRALLRFMTGLYVCLNRGDVDPKAQQVFVAFIQLEKYFLPQLIV